MKIRAVLYQDDVEKEIDEFMLDDIPATLSTLKIEVENVQRTFKVCHSLFSDLDERSEPYQVLQRLEDLDNKKSYFLLYGYTSEIKAVYLNDKKRVISICGIPLVNEDSIQIGNSCHRVRDVVLGTEVFNAITTEAVVSIFNNDGIEIERFKRIPPEFPG